MTGDAEQTSELSDVGGKLRLYVEDALHDGVQVPASESQAHYLLHVMRAKPGMRVALFNGRDGEWLAEIGALSKRGVTMTCLRESAPQTVVPDLWLAFAPIKKVPADYLVQKATELGVACLLPVMTHRTIVSRINYERMTANAIEAAEQSERLTVPQVREAVSLKKLLAGWPADRTLYFCDESGEAEPLAKSARAAPAAILTGPEGGFDDTERALLRALPFVTPVTLGPRILRADTAALAALSIWQSAQGDWT